MRISDLVEQGQTQRSRKPPGDAEHHAECGRAERDPERDPPSVQHAREQIAAELVGPEPVVPARRAEGVGGIDGVRPVGRQERRRDDGEHDHGQNGHRDHGTRLPAQLETATARYGQPGGDHRVAHAADLAVEPVPRIERRVQNVDDERGEDERGADEDDDALQDVVVALEDRLDCEGAQPGNPEDVLDDDGATQRVAHDQAEHRQARAE